MKPIFIGLISLAVAIFAMQEAEAQTRDLASQNPLGNNDCLPDSNWFPHSNTPEPDNKHFVFKSNCDFHKWSWQQFLWLTQTDLKTKQPRFLSFTTPNALVDVGPALLLPRMKKQDAAESFDEFLQAGPDGILIDHQGRAVYYSQYINPTFAGFISTNFFTKGAFDYKKVLQVLQNDPNKSFPDDAIELKVSWKIVHKGMDTSTFFTMKGQIQKLKHDNGKVVIDPSATDTVDLALVGFHIGGVVNGHTEMIWATFEHSDNAPNVFMAQPNPRKTISPKDPISAEDWTFYTAGTQYKDCNLNPVRGSDFKFDAKNQTFSPITEVCREYQFGDLAVLQPATTKQTNFHNIRSLNKLVRGKLHAEQDIWANYFELGAIWFLDPKKLKPGLALATNELMTGSIGLSNSTIETFTQTPNVQENCFRCHNTQQVFPANTSMTPLPASNLNISHAFNNMFFWSQPGGN